MWTVYGIRQCDTCRKALKWLDGQDIPHRFHDLRVDGFDASMLDNWLQSCSIESLINRRSTTWRNLDDADKASTDPNDHRRLLLENPTLVKRPVLFGDSVSAVGFRESEWLQLLGR